ncbi:MAG: DoxX family membrane protein [Alistipes sp.]
MTLKPLKLLSTVSRVILACTFIVSGFTKVVDPWGTAIKINEYLSIYGFEFLEKGSMLFSIWLCGAELMMGCMLLFKVRIRLVSIFAFVSLIFFTLLTFLSASWIPVEDCGCFGEAIKLTPWETFAKNMVMLPMSYLVWQRYRPDKIFAFKPMEIVLTGLFFTLSMGLGVFCCRHLPLVDFLPYKVGVNIYQAMNAPSPEPEGTTETVLVYRNLQTGEVREFALTDTTWQDTQTWEWQDTHTTSKEPNIKPLINDFAVHDVEGDVTEELLTTPGEVYMICVNSFAQLPHSCAKRLRSLVEQAQASGAQVVCLTPEPLREVTYHSFDGSEGVRCYNADASMLKTMLRANAGVVELRDGTIVAKKNCRDIRP